MKTAFYSLLLSAALAGPAQLAVVTVGVDLAGADRRGVDPRIEQHPRREPHLIGRRIEARVALPARAHEREADEGRDDAEWAGSEPHALET